jgi:hypothetical protein
VHRQRAVERPDRHEVLAVVEDPAPDPRALGLRERVMQQPVRVLALVLRAEVVGLGVEDRVDLVRADELLDLDQARSLAGRGLQLLVLEHHELALGDLVALHDLLVRDLLVLLRADPLVLDPRAVVLVDLVEVHGPVLGGRVDLHGHEDARERDRPVPDRAECHERRLPARARR